MRSLPTYFSDLDDTHTRPKGQDALVTSHGLAFSIEPITTIKHLRLLMELETDVKLLHRIVPIVSRKMTYVPQEPGIWWLPRDPLHRESHCRMFLNNENSMHLQHLGCLRGVVGRLNILTDVPEASNSEVGVILTSGLVHCQLTSSEVS